MSFFNRLGRRNDTRNSKRRTPTTPLQLEAMESRQLLTASPTYSLVSGSLYENTAGKTYLLATNVNSFQVTNTSAVVYLEQNGNLFEQVSLGNTQLLDRLVNSFQLTSSTQINVVDWFDRNLSNAGLCNLTRADFTRDDAITFSDMDGLFNEVLQSGAVTTSEVQNLQTITANPATLNMPGYVQNLASKVVNPTTNDLNYLSQYYAKGPSMPMLQGLVNQWFLGTVQPNAVDACDGDPAEDPNNVYTPAGATGSTLFGPNGPSWTDVAQGSAGDCWILSSLAETAARDPNIISNMFINNGNGSWTVRFYVNGAPDYVTVNDQLPETKTGGYAFDSPQNGVLWTALAEKAYAEENLSGRITTSEPGSDSYTALNGGYPSWALPTITGFSANLYTVVAGVTGPSIATDLQEGKLVCICTPNDSASGQAPNIDSYLVPGHCYAVVGYNPSSSMPFEVFNPWGINTYTETQGKTWGVFTSNGAFLEQNFVDWGVAGAGNTLTSVNPTALDAILTDSETMSESDDQVGFHNQTNPVESTGDLVSIRISGRRTGIPPQGPLSSSKRVNDLEVSFGRAGKAAVS